MNDIELIINEILNDSGYSKLKKKYIIEFWGVNNETAFFQLTSRDSAAMQFIMTAEILRIDDEEETDQEVRQEIIDYRLSLIANRINNTYLMTGCDNLLKFDIEEYVIKEYSLRIHTFLNESGLKVYYLVIIHEAHTKLQDMINNNDFIISDENVLKLFTDICLGIRYCHKKNVFHSNIVYENIYVENGVYKLGSLKFNSYMKNSYSLYNVENNSEPSAKNDLLMLGTAMKEISEILKLKDYVWGSNIQNVIEKACGNMYNDIDEVIEDLKLLKTNGAKKRQRLISILTVIFIIILLIVIALLFILKRSNEADDDKTAYNTGEISEITTAAKDENTNADAEIMLGDCNGDGIVDATDASLILDIYSEAVANKRKITEKDIAVCDVDGDGQISPSDSSFILEYYAYVAAAGPCSLQEYIDMK